jgi:prophage regulatory protein|tara:strand:+ start:46519 stop:46767 length:249 start_codon:yes stop_codon:yes gene_type:complete
MLEQKCNDNEQVSPQRLIRLKEVMHRVGLGRSTIYRWMDEGKFPKPHSLGGYAVAWLEADINRWIDEQIAHFETRSDRPGNC